MLGYNHFVGVNVVTVSSTAIKDLIQRAIELELIAATDLVTDGLPGSSGRAAKTLARGLRSIHDRPTVGDLAGFADVELAALPGVASGTLDRIRQGLIEALLIEAQRRGDAEEVTWEEIGPRHTTALTGRLADVSNPCREGRHYRCSGKIALQQLRHGRRYARCKCPYCAQVQDPAHTKKIRTMPLKD